MVTARSFMLLALFTRPTHNFAMLAVVLVMAMVLKFCPDRINIFYSVDT